MSFDLFGWSPGRRPVKEYQYPANIVGISLHAAHGTLFEPGVILEKELVQFLNFASVSPLQCGPGFKCPQASRICPRHQKTACDMLRLIAATNGSATTQPGWGHQWFFPMACGLAIEIATVIGVGFDHFVCHRVSSRATTWSSKHFLDNDNCENGERRRRARSSEAAPVSRRQTKDTCFQRKKGTSIRTPDS